MPIEHWGWVLFALAVLTMMLLDLGVFHRKAHEVKFREAVAWSVVWVVLALGFGVYVYISRGAAAAQDFLAAYLIEESLSVDNLFVFLLIFHYFQVPGQYQHRVLFWGILGALAMRAVFIVAGIVLIRQFHWVIYFFGLFLIFTGVKLALDKDKKIDPERNPVLRLFRRWVPITNEFVQGKFFTRRDGRWLATPLFVVLLVIETTDVIFAVDSIPAVLAVTSDPFIVFTSNTFAILGLRSMYFALAGMMQLFHYLHYGLATILVFVGAKMLLADVVEIPGAITLAVVGGILAVSVLASWLLPLPKEEEEPALLVAPTDAVRDEQAIRPQ